MPSYRYLRDIPPENLAAEPPPEYTRLNRWKNWWHYHWKWVAVALAAAALAAAFVVELVRTEEPDITLGILTPYALPAELTDELASRLAGIAGDLNGDGKALAAVEVYTIDFSGNENANQQIAGVARLVGAFESGSCMLFAAAPEQAALYQENYGLFGTARGSYVEDGDAEALTVPFSALVALNAEPLDLPYISEDGAVLDGRQVLAGYRVGLRALYGTKLENSAPGAEAWRRAQAVFLALQADGRP